MDMTMIWFYLAAACILAEFILPGAILVFLGLAAATVGSLLLWGLIDNWYEAITAFFLISMIYVLLIRSLFFKFFPGETTITDVDQNHEAIGSIVEVIETITRSRAGRIRYRNTSWQAMSDEEFAVGAKAIIIDRKDQIWIVASADKGD